MRRTALAQLVEHKLGQSLTEYVKARQSDGIGWRRIAQELHEECGVLVSHESLRSWFKHEQARQAA